MWTFVVFFRQENTGGRKRCEFKTEQSNVGTILALQSKGTLSTDGDVLKVEDSFVVEVEEC